MSDKFIINRGREEIIAGRNYQSGALWFTEDSQNLYMDSKDGKKRIQITDVIDITNKDNAPEIYYPNKIYIDGYRLKKYKSPKELETIVELESEVLESKNEFYSYSDDLTTAKLKVNSLPKKGTIVVDNLKNVGVVTQGNKNSSDLVLDVVIISNNNFKNVLNGYDIYFDSNYTGNQVGTFHCPFNTWNDLYAQCTSELKNNGGVTIHIKSNSSLHINENFTDLNYVTFVTDDAYSTIEFDKNLEITNNSYLTFNNVRLAHISNGGEASIEFINCSYITFKDNIFEHGLTLDNCEDITILNAKNIQEIRLNNHTKNVKIRNVISNVDIICNNTDGTNSIIDCYIDNMIVEKLIIKDENIDDDDKNNGNIELINTTIRKSINVDTCETFSLIACNMLNINGASECKILADNVNIGASSFNNIIPTLPETPETVNILSTLSPEQTSSGILDDYMGRAYDTPDNNTLKAHLDAISRTILTINQDIAELKNIYDSLT